MLSSQLSRVTFQATKASGNGGFQNDHYSLSNCSGVRRLWYIKEHLTMLRRQNPVLILTDGVMGTINGEAAHEKRTKTRVP